MCVRAVYSDHNNNNNNIILPRAIVCVCVVRTGRMEKRARRETETGRERETINNYLSSSELVLCFKFWYGRAPAARVCGRSEAAGRE